MKTPEEKMMAKKTKKVYWIARRPFGYNNQKLSVGQLLQPVGMPNDWRLFKKDEATHWAAPFDGEPLPCDVNGCPALFGNEMHLEMHRRQRHHPRQEELKRVKQQQFEKAMADEAAGRTIGGREVEMKKRGGKDVPYLPTEQIMAQR